MPGEGFAPGEGSMSSTAAEASVPTCSSFACANFGTCPLSLSLSSVCRREAARSLPRSLRRRPRGSRVSALTPSPTWLCSACTARSRSRRCTPGASWLVMAAHLARTLTRRCSLAISTSDLRASTTILPPPRTLAKWQSPSSSLTTPWPFTSRLQCRPGTPQIQKPRTRAAAGSSRSTATSARQARRGARAHAERAAARAQAAGARRLSGAFARQRGSSHRQ